jgi:mono/diheme cytochrome c family protein
MKRIVTALFALAFATVAAAADGAAVYKAKCAMCHGAAGEGTKMGGAVKGKTADAAKKAVTAGVKAAAGKKEMKPVKLEAADVDAVSAFVGGLK